MEPSDRKEFLGVVVGLAELRGKQLSAPAIELYWESLKDWPIADFKSAAQYLLKATQFMPTPYDFEQLRKSNQRTSGEAFQKAREIVRQLNHREMISHSSGDSRLDAAIRACGGFEALAACETDNIGFFERRFAEHFDTISEATDTREALPMIARIDGPRRLLGAA